VGRGAYSKKWLEPGVQAAHEGNLKNEGSETARKRKYERNKSEKLKLTKERASPPPKPSNRFSKKKGKGRKKGVGS